jgi:hypothetical protein
LNPELLFMSDDIILIAHMPGSLLDLNKNKYDILNTYSGPQGHKTKWSDQDNDFFDRGTQGAADTGFKVILL